MHLAPLSEAIASNPVVWQWAVAIFVCGVCYLSIFLRKRHQLSGVKAVLGVFGLVRVNRDWIVVSSQLTTFVIPMLLIVYLYVSM